MFAKAITVEEDVKPEEDVVQKADGYDGSASLRCKILKRNSKTFASDQRWGTYNHQGLARVYRGLWPEDKGSIDQPGKVETVGPKEEHDEAQANDHLPGEH